MSAPPEDVLCGGLSACDDGDPCTTDVCDAKEGCVSTPNTAACDDSDPCTVSDQCSAGVCAGSPVACEGGVPTELPDEPDPRVPGDVDPPSEGGEGGPATPKFDTSTMIGKALVPALAADVAAFHLSWGAERGGWGTDPGTGVVPGGLKGSGIGGGTNGGGVSESGEGDLAPAQGCDASGGGALPGALFLLLAALPLLRLRRRGQAS
jgi:hypothetical protein